MQALKLQQRPPRGNAVRAYHEWLPTRYFIDDDKYTAIYRSFQFGESVGW